MRRVGSPAMYPRKFIIFTSAAIKLSMSLSVSGSIWGLGSDLCCRSKKEEGEERREGAEGMELCVCACVCSWLLVVDGVVPCKYEFEFVFKRRPCTQLTY